MKSVSFAVAALALSAAAMPARADTLRLASLAPADSAWGKLIQEMAASVKQSTGGEVQFQLYLGGKLGDEAKVAKKLGHGLDGAFFTGQGVGLILPAFRVQELPFLVESYAEADKLREALWPTFEKAFAEKTEYVLVGPGETGMVYAFSKKPIKSVEELRSAKLWVWEGDTIASETFKVFGVSPRPLDILTVVQQLKSGGIDTVYAPPAGAVALGWTADLAYVSGRPFAHASGGFILTKKAWNKIPDAHKETIKKIVGDSSQKIIAQARKDNDAAMARLIGAGGGLAQVPISDAMYQEFKKVGVGAWPALAKNIGAIEQLEKARAALGK